MNQPSVFISCVSPEFRQTRNRVAAILARLGYTPIIQEIFGTDPATFARSSATRSTPARASSRLLDMENEFYAVNGYANYYVEHPIEIRAGEKVRIYLSATW